MRPRGQGVFIAKHGEDSLGSQDFLLAPAPQDAANTRGCSTKRFKLAATIQERVDVQHLASCMERHHHDRPGAPGNNSEEEEGEVWWHAAMLQT